MPSFLRKTKGSAEDKAANKSAKLESIVKEIIIEHFQSEKFDQDIIQNWFKNHGEIHIDYPRIVKEIRDMN